MLSQMRVILRRFTQHRSTRLTSEGLYFLLFTLAVGIAAINTGNNLFYLLLAMLLGMIVISGIAAESCLRRLEFHRHFPDLLFVDEPATATLVMKNGKSWLPSFSLSLFDVHEGTDLDRGLVVPQLLPGSSRLLSYPLVATRRGRLRLDGVRAATAFPFGLFLKKAYYPVEGMALASPRPKPLPDDILNDLLVAGQEQAIHRRGYGNELYNIRQYKPGDDSRNIHWVTTARTAKLMVRETEADQQRRATVQLSVLAPDSHNQAFEEAVSFTVSLVHHLAVRGYHLKLSAGSTHSSFGQGEAHLADLLRILALCERRSPDSEVQPQDDRLSEQHDMESGTVIRVRPWNGVEMSGAEDPGFLLDAETFVGVPHVL
jgi:uncharacterized protein (DUF58 family)